MMTKRHARKSSDTSAAAARETGLPGGAAVSGSAAQLVIARLEALAEPDRVDTLRRFFKTGPGDYGEGDVFLGLRVPTLRQLSKELGGLALADALELLQSPYHEARLLALLLLVRAYERGDAELRESIFRAYLDNTSRVNNWDLIDSSAPHIVGAHLASRDRDVLRQLAASPSLWERRIAMLATFHFIKRGDFDDALAIAEQLLLDQQDLIRKAVGWMLREIGERDRQAEEHFLRKHCRKMPRTMLRYALEKFDPESRRLYMEGRVDQIDLPA